MQNNSLFMERVVFCDNYLFLSFKNIKTRPTIPMQIPKKSKGSESRLLNRVSLIVSPDIPSKMPNRINAIPCNCFFIFAPLFPKYCLTYYKIAHPFCVYTDRRQQICRNRSVLQSKRSRDMSRSQSPQTANVLRTLN